MLFLPMTLCPGSCLPQNSRVCRSISVFCTLSGIVNFRLAYLYLIGYNFFRPTHLFFFDGLFPKADCRTSENETGKSESKATGILPSPPLQPKESCSCATAPEHLSFRFRSRGHQPSGKLYFFVAPSLAGRSVAHYPQGAAHRMESL